MIDNGLKGGMFSFTKVKNFDNHINSQIQGFDILNEIILSLSIRYIENDSNVYDLGSSTGRLVNNLHKKYKDVYSNVNYYGIEKNSNFLDAKTFSNEVSFINKDIAGINSFDNASLILSIFTIQFLANRAKQKIIHNIFDSLNYKGAFIWAEKTYMNNPVINNDVTMDHYSSKLDRYSAEEILNDEVSLRSQMKLNTENQNILLLQQAGFKTYDIIWKIRNFECILAIKE